MPVEVLLIEDNEGDWRLIQQITSQSAVPVRTTVVPNCASALMILAERQFVPNVVITDMSVPGAGAPELLKQCTRWIFRSLFSVAQLMPRTALRLYGLG